MCFCMSRQFDYKILRMQIVGFRGSMGWCLMVIGQSRRDGICGCSKVLLPRQEVIVTVGGDSAAYNISDGQVFSFHVGDTINIRGRSAASLDVGEFSDFALSFDQNFLQRTDQGLIA
jgi:hypothetical protein